jgi:hypothetical protein
MFMAMSDMDGDGKEEVILEEKNHKTIRIYRKIGIEWKEQIIKVPDFTGNCKSVEVGDINGDGIKDLVFSTETGGDVKVGLTWLNGKYLNQENPKFQAISKLHRSNYDCVELIDIHLDGDLNGDGFKDLVFSTETGGEVKIGLTWVTGKDLDQENPKFQAISKLHRSKYDRVELIDIDLDGDLDILICEENFGENSQGLGVIWYENKLDK